MNDDKCIKCKENRNRAWKEREYKHCNELRNDSDQLKREVGTLRVTNLCMREELDRTKKELYDLKCKVYPLELLVDELRSSKDMWMKLAKQRLKEHKDSIFTGEEHTKLRKLLSEYELKSSKQKEGCARCKKNQRMAIKDVEKKYKDIIINIEEQRYDKYPNTCEYLDLKQSQLFWQEQASKFDDENIRLQRENSKLKSDNCFLRSNLRFFYNRVG